MIVQVLFFAAIREAVGTASLALDTSATTVAELRDGLIARGSPWAEALARGKPVRASVNQTMVDEQTRLSPGVEVAFFPPVTGG